ncbi:hypothetical protein FHW12_001440 [Dokdonella fugitiva]|uniref:Outer membrane lipoprotein carrier protein LolA n=1 Tax=Dokdonella fugitiva TaxID=328517 RepID=A0A839EXW2_9GAMM|nr:LolA-related protein [Dokdonella fugitiva]MBA8887226.1 hypothetical protein [Dokdonella fugitiva]
MTSGIPKAAASKRARRLALLAALVAATPSYAAPAEAPDAATLVARLRRDVPARTPYTEVRFSGLLERPLILRGELEYLGPGRLGKRVDTPYREQTRVENGAASVQRGDRPARTFSLGQAPELEGFLRGFAALLGGDAATLAADFTLSASGDAHAWQLVLKPRDERLARRVGEIRVDGSERTPLCFVTREGDGDVAVLLVDRLAAAKLPARPSQPQLEAICRDGATP